MDNDCEYLPLKELAKYAGLSLRTLRSFLHLADRPLPYYQPGGGKVLVKRSEFDDWMQRFRKCEPARLDAIVDEIFMRVS